MEICNTTKLECGHCMPVCEHRRMVFCEDERQQILQSAINTYGPEHQVDMAIEEMAELTKALLKMRRDKSSGDYNVREEIVDVQIVLDQLKMIYGWDNEIQAQKLGRLWEAIKDEQESRSTDQGNDAASQAVSGQSSDRPSDQANAGAAGICVAR